METNKRDNLTKEDIVKNISLKFGISTSYSATILNDLIDILILNISVSEKIKINNFGNFILQKKKKDQEEILKVKKNMIFQLGKL